MDTGFVSVEIPNAGRQANPCTKREVNLTTRLRQLRDQVSNNSALELLWIGPGS